MLQTCQGACHRGRGRFEVEADLGHVRACDCPLCTQRGALIHRVEDACLRLLTPLDALKVYRRHTHIAADRFCPCCSTLPLRRPRTAPHLWGANVRCLAGVDLAVIPIQPVRGRQPV